MGDAAEPRAGCPHTWSSVAKIDLGGDPEDRACPVCLTEFFRKHEDGGYETPVKLLCGHIIGKKCLSEWRRQSLTCPNCRDQRGFRPDECEQCEELVLEAAERKYQVIDIRPRDVLEDILVRLRSLADGEEYFALPESAMWTLRDYWSKTLRARRFQYLTAIELAETLDPFLIEAERTNAQDTLGREASKLTPEGYFSPRNINWGDYPAGEEPWIAAFLRDWAAEYVGANGQERLGHVWGEYTTAISPENGYWNQLYRPKRIIGHHLHGNTLRYLVKWVGDRWGSEWVDWRDLREMTEMLDAYNARFGIVLRL
ncbi:hypothetical protein CC78DRAFT_566289 [Lojkania enalia]|uniref:RING-type domain-containing protein n=1 Tax=Lojkania enalia TaxID=147567 RepID=A0A9P4KGN2_9PLEO|nr:hypothetical protein CC78DRAFT_566289 [Didymosphaeria enalia]